jgi:hypothetical protein
MVSFLSTMGYSNLALSGPFGRGGFSHGLVSLDHGLLEFGPFRAVWHLLSAFSFQLSAFSFQLSALCFQLREAINYALCITNYALKKLHAVA